MKKIKKLIIIGDGEFGEIAYEYFTYDSDYEVCAFVVEKEYLTQNSLFGLPVISFDEMENQYPPELHDAFVAITNTNFNRVRERLFYETKGKGYKLTSYISSRAFIWRNVRIGENCFVFEHNTLQYHVSIGDNCIIWSGNHIGHRTNIGNHCFITSHVVISGYCKIGDYSYLAVNSTFNDKISVGKNTFVGSGALVVKSFGDNCFLKGSPAKPDSISSIEKFLK